MNDLLPGTPVLFDRNCVDYVGTIRETATVGVEDGYIIKTAGYSAALWFAPDDAVTPLPDGTPMLPNGATVHVLGDVNADRYGTVGSPEFHGDLFGYWVHLTDPTESVWVPAVLLAAVRIGGA